MSTTRESALRNRNPGYSFATIATAVRRLIGF